MQSIKTVDNQSLLDVALQLYGTVDAIVNLIDDNDFAGKLHMPGGVGADEVDLAATIKPDTVIAYDVTAPIYNAAEIKRLSEVFGDEPIIIATGLVKGDFKLHNSVYSDLYN